MWWFIFLRISTYISSSFPLCWHQADLSLFLYSIPACKLMNQHLAVLAKQFKSTKFLKIVSDQCVPNYPDRNVPTLLVYGEGDIKANIVGAIAFGGMNMTVSSKDWIKG